MKEIVSRLHENRQIELAKSILESKGYKVSKKPLKESYDKIDIYGEISLRDEALALTNKILNNLEDYYGDDYEDALEEIGEVERALLSVLERDKDAVYYSDIGMTTYRVEDIIADTGNDYFGKGYVKDEAGNTYYGYFRVARSGPRSDGMVDFIHSNK